jgi:choline dehydrogenase
MYTFAICSGGSDPAQNDGAEYPNVQFEFLPLARFVSGGKLRVFPGFQLWIDLSRPLSRGYVRLRSADPNAAPEIVFNHYAEEEDRKDIVRSVRIARDLFAQPAWDGARGEEVQPGADARTNADILRWTHKATGASYHPSGTCRMSKTPAHASSTPIAAFMASTSCVWSAPP